MNNTTEPTVTSKQFISFETISGLIFTLLFAVCSWAWIDRWTMADARFEKVDDRFEKVDTRFEKVESKQDQMILMLSEIKTQMAKMATKDDILAMSLRISGNETSIGILNAKVEYLENKGE
ncbi:MAG: hypothetical protein ACI8WB_000692 [Phenylobacterium sp.]|jgi:uncharacterized protein YdcH (DUF465 family)